MSLASGATFAGFTVQRLLGSGGMGEVYLAQHPRLPRRDALKLLPREASTDPDFRERFNREADLASTLWHPHIVGVHDRGEFDGQLWISMDFVDGLDAARLMADRYPSGMPQNQVINIITAMASALDYANKQGLLHRDVKPANIMLTHLDDAGEQRILLTDFGIARNVDDISGLTATNMTVGTVAYSAPEQLMGEGIDGRADQYALAATAYHLLTGSQLFPHSNPAVVISRHLNTNPPALADIRPELAALDPVMSAALAKNPDDRFPRCSDFARALAEQSAAHGALSPMAPTTPAPVLNSPAASTTPPPVREAANGPAGGHGSRRRWLVPVTVAAVLLVLAGGITLTWHPWDNRHPIIAQTNSIPSPPASTPVSTAPISAPSPAAPPPVFPATSTDAVLLTAAELNSILGTYTSSGGGQIGLMKVDESSYGMTDHSSQVTPPNCAGVVYGAEHAVYGDTGFQGMRDQTFSQEPYGYNPTAATTAPDRIEQTIVVFPSAEQAQAFTASSEKQWRACANGKVDSRTGPESGSSFILGSVQRQDDLLTVSMASNGGMDGAYACQQVLGVRENVIIGAHSCGVPANITNPMVDANPDWATNDAERLANAMLNKIKE